MAMRTWDRLNATKVRNTNAPGKYHDGGGLLLNVAATSTPGEVNKSWLFRFQLDNRERAMGLGPVRVVSLGEARARANECRKLLAAGIDPLDHRNAERQKARAAALHRATFKQVLDMLLASHGDKWRQKHATQYRNSMATYAKPLMNISVADIDIAMVIKTIEPQWKRIPETMDRVRRRIGEVLAYAQVRELRPRGPLPTEWKDHLEKLLPHPREIKPVEHHAALGYAQVPELYAKLTATDSIPELALAFAILTATRSGEARGARWDEIDLKAGIWTVPPQRMKRKREHRVPLSDEAIKLIERLPRTGEYLFTVNGNAKPIVAMSLRKALARHGGDGFTAHGMRSAFRDWGGECTSAPRELLEVALAHALGNQTEEAYARGDLLKKRAAIMQAWADHCRAAPTGNKVIPLHGERQHG